MRKGFFHSSRGGVNYVTILFILFLLVVLFAVIWVLPKWMKNYQVKHEMYALMVNAVNLSDAQITSQLADIAEAKGVPLSVEQISCRRAGGEINCRYEFTWPVVVAGKELMQLPFAADQTRPVTELQKKLSQP